MKSKITVEQVMSYTGFNKRSVYYWMAKKVNFDEVILCLKKCKRYGCERNIIYETFLALTNELVVERIWNIYINHRLRLEEIKEKNKQHQKIVNQIKQDVLNGRKV